MLLIVKMRLKFFACLLFLTDVVEKAHEMVEKVE